MNINANNLRVERKIKELFYNDRSRVQFTKISQFGLMEISGKNRTKYLWTFYNKCNCCSGSGFKKTNSIFIHNIILILKVQILLKKKMM